MCQSSPPKKTTHHHHVTYQGVLVSNSHTTYVEGGPDTPGYQTLARAHVHNCVQIQTRSPLRANVATDGGTVISEASALMGHSECEPAHTAALSCIVSERG